MTVFMGSQSLEVAAKLLAGEHLAQDPGIRRVYWAPAEREIRLIEVSDSIEDGRGVLPFRFTPDPPDVPFPSVIIQLSPEDYRKLRANEIDVPDGFEAVELVAER
jgi:hypothetical protein